MSLNKVMLIGNVGKDPEVTNHERGGKCAKFTLATNERYTDKQGNKTERTDWHNIVAWGPIAELCEKYVTKGKQLYVEGQIRNRSWEQDGVKKFATDININQVLFISNVSNNNSSNTSNSSDSSSSSSKTSKPTKSSKENASIPEPAPAAIDDTDDDLPF